MLISPSRKSISQQVNKSVRKSESTSPAITDSAGLQYAYTVGKTIPQGFYSVKVRMSVSSSQAGYIGESREKQLSSVCSHLSTPAHIILSLLIKFVVVFNPKKNAKL